MLLLIRIIIFKLINNSVLKHQLCYFVTLFANYSLIALMLFCLSYLCPGKTGSIVRKFSILLLGIVLVYAVCWALVLKGLKFNPISAVVKDQQFLVQEIQIENTSYLPIELIDLNFYSQESTVVEKTTEGLPASIKSMGYENIKIITQFVKFEYIEICVRIMGLKKSFKQKIPKIVSDKSDIN